MRDNKQHATLILGKIFTTIYHPKFYFDIRIVIKLNMHLGGMWGFRGLMNRKMADMMFVKMIDRDVSIKYNKIKNIKGHDQYFLGHHVYPLVKINSTIHDSFLCKMYNDSTPFPTQRKGGCFVGQSGPGDCYPDKIAECPVECRPKSHQDWIHC